MQTLADWQGTACILRAGLTASYAGHVGAVLAGSALAVQGPGIGYLVGLAAWGYLVYLQVRVALDAELFSWLANGGDLAEIDDFLVRAGLISATRERSADERCRGALRLWRRLIAALVVELAAVGAGLAIGLR
ncbi:MAG: hypothetical protein ACKV2U_06910 [Bryobacteraceae bacterium]